MFVEAEQIAHEQGGGLGFLVVFDVEDAEVFAVAVAVKIAIGVVKGDCLAVFLDEFGVVGGGECLSEGCAVFKGEAGFGEFIAIASPDFASAAFVSFVNEDEVVSLECLHGNADTTAAFLLDQFGNFDDLDGVSAMGKFVAFDVKSFAGDVGGGEFAEVLLA